jgi:hypothetical protein
VFKIYSAGNIQDAYLLQGLLNESGIETRILNEYAQGGVGEIPFTQAYPEIWLVNKSDSERAKEIIKQFDARQGHDDVFCARCHEPNPDTFETCWHCGNPLKAD